MKVKMRIRLQRVNSVEEDNKQTRSKKKTDVKSSKADHSKKGGTNKENSQPPKSEQERHMTFSCPFSTCQNVPSFEFEDDYYKHLKEIHQLSRM